MEILLVTVVIAILVLAAIFWGRRRKARLAEKVTELLNQSFKIDNRVEQAPVAQEAEVAVAAAPVEENREPQIQTTATFEFEDAPAPVLASAAKVAEPAIPEDSVLRRHYLSRLQAEREAITNPYPTDSTLRRHYQSMRVVSPAVNQSREVTLQTSMPCKQTRLPEDSALRRHVLTQVRAEIAERIGPRPTDSSLIRHYDARLNAELENYLSGKV